MGRNNFKDTLDVPQRPDKRSDPKATVGGQPGPHASGPALEGDLSWVYVWIIQNGPGGHAASAFGESKGPFTSDEWDTNTTMSPDSNDFIPGKPALATAMALVVRGDDDKEVDWWSEAIMIKRAGTS